MEKLEEKLKIESEILSKKRELKYAAESLERVKSDTNDLLIMKEKVTKEIDQRNTELTEVLNKISDAELAWALKKQAEIDEIEKKNKKADEILALKGTLEEKEKNLTQIKEETTKIRNENRSLELKLAADKMLLEVKEKEIIQLQKDHEAQNKAARDDIEQIKQRLLKIIESIQAI